MNPRRIQETPANLSKESRKDQRAYQRNHNIIQKHQQHFRMNSRRIPERRTDPWGEHWKNPGKMSNSIRRIPEKPNKFTRIIAEESRTTNNTIKTIRRNRKVKPTHQTNPKRIPGRSASLPEES